jgi:hypothetical protein
MRKRQWREQHEKNDGVVPTSIPYLQLPVSSSAMPRSAVDGGGVASRNTETREEIFGWRRLPRPEIANGTFLANALKTHTRGPDNLSSNTLNKPLFLMPISPVDACKYVPEDFTGKIESIFVPDARKDMERSIATMERNIRREKELMRNLPTDDLLLFGEAKEFTATDVFMQNQAAGDKAAVQDPKEKAVENAILAAKSSNISMMEDALAEDIPINVADAFGNTLLILAAQQGSKRMCKFLLRRGANINLQSLGGNTALHYCYAYSQHSLADYLKKKVIVDYYVALLLFFVLSVSAFPLSLPSLHLSAEQLDDATVAIVVESPCNISDSFSLPAHHYSDQTTYNVLSIYCAAAMP